MSDERKALCSAALGGFCAVLYDISVNELSNVEKMSRGLSKFHLPGSTFLPFLLVIGIAVALCWIFDEKSKSTAFYVGLSVFGTIGFLTLAKSATVATPSYKIPSAAPESALIPSANSVTQPNLSTWSPGIVFASSGADNANPGFGDIWLHLTKTPTKDISIEVKGRDNDYFTRSSFESSDAGLRLAAGKTYIVTISSPGYQIVRLEVRIEANDYKRFNIELQPSSMPVGLQKLFNISEQAQPFSGFGPGCRLPFEAIKVMRPIDAVCGTAGLFSSLGQHAQNIVKNNFCALEKPVPITFENLIRLQRSVNEQGISFGSPTKLPMDRSPLQHLIVVGDDKIGEGSVVRLMGFIMTTHVANIQLGENVNCRLQGEENNNIHIALVRTPTEDDACSSVTAQISPHFRPEVWTVSKLRELGKRPIRVTGQLFFDASHLPCEAGHKASPARATVWEIHPVYGIESCTDENVTKCNVENSSKWVPLG